MVDRARKREAVARPKTGGAKPPSTSARSEEVYRLLMEQSPVGIIIAGVDGQITKANPAALAMLGSPSEDATRKFNLLTVPNLRRAGISQMVELTLGENRVERLETTYESVWGKTSVVSVTTAPLCDAAGTAVGAVLLAEDVTASRRAAAERLGLLEISHDLSSSDDLDAIIDRVHQRAAALLPCEQVGTYYWDEERESYRAARRWGVSPALEAEVARLEARLRPPPVGTATAVFNDIDAQDVLPTDLLHELNVGSLILVPLNVRGRPRAAMVAVRIAPAKPFDASEQQLFEGIARQVTIALERADLDRAQQEETAIAAALARVGRELITSFNSPALVDRLCRLTAEVLECDCSYTLLLRPDEGVFAPAAQAGDSPEDWERHRALRLPRELGSTFEHGDVVQVTLPLSDRPLALAQRSLRLDAGLYMALRRGGEICGLHVAAMRGADARFRPLQERIAGGVAQLASFALENARLLSELESASRLKSDFVATMSHELRTPLNAIIGYCDLLLDGAYGKLGIEQGIAIKRLQGRADELFELITATLDVSRLEAGQLPLDLVSVNPADLLEDLRNESYRFPLQPGVTLRWQLAESLPVVRTDAVKVKVILKNLLKNAAKFTERGTITVVAQAASEALELRVSDTGIGIGAEERRHIFEAFRQVDGSNTRRFGGVGLGLYIVRRLLELLGGRIEVESEVGKGTTFRVFLPMT